jgi:hypothetical protein
MELFEESFYNNIEIYQNVHSHICDHIVNNTIDQIENVILQYLNYYNPNHNQINQFIANCLICNL